MLERDLNMTLCNLMDTNVYSLQKLERYTSRTMTYLSINKLFFI